MLWPHSIFLPDTHCCLTAPAYPVWAYYAHGRQRRCQEDPVSLPSGLEKTTRSSPHHVAQRHPTGSETTPPYAPRSSRFGSEPPSVEDDVDVWRYAILEVHARNDDDDALIHEEKIFVPCFPCFIFTLMCGIVCFGCGVFGCVVPRFFTSVNLDLCTVKD